MTLKMHKLAAIDIGSNAVRLLIANVLEQDGKPTKFRKNSLVRVPVRLGADVFTEGIVSDSNCERIVATMKAFSHLMEVHNVHTYKACATSAMREAGNATKLVDMVAHEAGIQIDIIGGKEEALIIAATDLDTFIDVNKNYLYVDVGGGSTEFTVIQRGIKKKSKSFKIGTVRLLHDLVEAREWEAAMAWVTEQTANYEAVSVLGSGGNINKIFKLSGKKIGEPLTYFYMTATYEKLQTYNYEERITELELNPDRADVIIHALRIYLSAMKWCKAKHIYVPKIGLSDGIIKSLYNGAIAGQPLR